MSLYLVTALPGSGKTTVCHELQARGFEAYDGDEDHLAKWFNDETGEPVLHERDRSPEFLQAHSRNIDRSVVERLAATATDKTVFLCGDPENEEELLDLFDTVFALELDEPTRQHRLATRTNNQWGKLAHEVEYDLALQPVVLERHRKFGYTILDASQPPEIVVEQILATI